MAFNDAAVRSLLSSMVSIAAKTGQFRSINTFEPKSSPGSSLRLAIWADVIEPIAGASGLASSSGYVTMMARIYGNMLQKPEDEIDPRLMSAATALVGAFSADFTLGGTVRNVDLLGMYGTKLGAQAGYITIGGTMYRIMTVTVPCVINDMWDQVA